MHFIKHQPGAFVWNEFVHLQISSGNIEKCQNEITETFPKYLEANQLDQIHCVIII